MTDKTCGWCRPRNRVATRRCRASGLAVCDECAGPRAECPSEGCDAGLRPIEAE